MEKVFNDVYILSLEGPGDFDSKEDAEANLEGLILDALGFPPGVKVKAIRISSTEIIDKKE